MIAQFTVRNFGLIDSVSVELPGGLEIVSIITRKSAADLNLATGKDVYAVVKASSVMIAVD